MTLEFSVVLGGTAFDENSLLLGGASDGGRVAPKPLGWVRRRRRPTPSVSGSHPSLGGDSQRRSSQEKTICIVDRLNLGQ